MTRIERSRWIEGEFARVLRLVDVLTEPLTGFLSLDALERDRFRNNQAIEGDAVRVLSRHQGFSLVMKIDGSRGWVPSSSLEPAPGLRDFIRPRSPRMGALEFLESYRGVPYLWGGLSSAGVDCSGLMQLYFFCVHDLIIPRNSREQRAAAPEDALAAARDDSLVYGLGKAGGGHHVGLFLDSMIWHSYTAEGVVCHSLSRFSERFEIQAVNSLLRMARESFLGP